MEPTNNKATQLSPIANDRAITFIEKFVKENRAKSSFQIPTAWLYERGIKESIERAATSGMTGLRFYSAINVEKYPSEPGILTFIMVPAKVNNKGIFEDLSNEVVYEFSQICPDMCSVGVTGNFINYDGSFTVPNSYYFPISYFETNFSSYPDSAGMRLYRKIENGRLELDMLPVIEAAPKYNDLGALTYPQHYEVCDSSNLGTCALTSVFYKV